MMKLLFNRDQDRTGIRRKAIFKLHAQVELEDDEQLLIERYDFKDAVLIEVPEPGLARNATIFGFIVVWIAAAALFMMAGTMAAMVGVLIGIFFGWLYYDRHRETILVNDLIHGRYFDCRSVVELSRKEAWLGVVVSYLRQVMEAAKNWGETEIITVEALSKQEAKFVVIRGL
jgi:hypothetical protein